MDFISLNEVIGSMAEENSGVADEGRYSEKAFDEAAKYAEAASALHQAIHNNGEGLRWVEISRQTGKTLFSDAVSIEGMDMLAHTAGWRERLADEHIRYLTDCESAEKAGIDTSLIKPAVNLNGGQHTMKGYFRVAEIGFDRSELAAFFNNLGMPCRFYMPTPVKPEKKTDPQAKPIHGWEVKQLERTSHLAGHIYEILCIAHTKDPVTPPRWQDVVNTLVERVGMEISRDKKEYVYAVLEENDKISKDALRRRVSRMIDHKTDVNAH